jgi:chemotaxis protein MotB
VNATGQTKASPAYRRANRRRGDTLGGHQPDNAERWLLTYSDMITLLLVLFMVLFALSKVNEAKYREFRQSVTRAVLSNVPHGTTKLPKKSQATLTSATRLGQLKRELSSALNAKGLLGDVTLTINSSGLVEGLVADSTFFVTASATLSTVGRQIVDTSAQVLRHFSNAVEVAGYTDDRIITGGPYPNNWALSAARAATVVVRMTQVDGVRPKRVILLGYGQYHPVATNESPAGRAENRRVNIVVKPTSRFGS